MHDSSPANPRHNRASAPQNPTRRFLVTQGNKFSNCFLKSFSNHFMGDAADQELKLSHDDLHARKFWNNWLGTLPDLPDDEKLRLLLREQDECQRSKRRNDPQLLSYIRKNLEEMTQTAPATATATDQWLWHLYEKALQKEIDCMISKQRSAFSTVNASSRCVLHSVICDVPLFRIFFLLFCSLISSSSHLPQ